MTKTVVQGAKFGLLLGLLNVANVQILTWLGLGLTSWVIAIDLILLVLVVATAQLNFKSKNEEVLEFKDALILNLPLILIASFISTAYLYFYITQIDPEWVENVAEIRRQALVESGADGASIENRIAAFRLTFRPEQMFTRGIIVPALWNFLFAGIVTFFTKSKRVTA